MFDVFVVEDEQGNGRYSISCEEWAEKCAVFLTSYMVFPPFDVVKKFCGNGILNYGMSGFLSWRGFDIDVQEYMIIFSCLKNKFHGLIYVDPESIHQKMDDEYDLMAWKQEVAFGVPFHENRAYLGNLAELQRQYNKLLEAGEFSLELWEKIADEEKRQNEFVAMFKRKQVDK